MNKSEIQKENTMTTTTVRIKTNHHWYPILSAYELTSKEIGEFDCLDDEEKMYPRFVRYRGTVYDISEFMDIHDSLRPAMASDDPMSKWDGYQSETHFSGVIVRYNMAFDAVQIGTYFS